MSRANSISQPVKQALAAAACALFFPAGLIYFEAFHFSSGLHQGPVVLLCALAGFFTAGLLIRIRHTLKPNQALINMLGLYVVAVLLTSAALFIYAGALSPGGWNASLASGLLTKMSLLSMLPLITGLLLWQQPAVVTPKGEKTQPTDAQAPHLPAGEALAAAISLETGGERLQIQVQQLILIEAADNYCKFVFLADNQRKTRVLRMTLKEAEDALNPHAGFYRCHRSYLVNGKWVEEVRGNSQAYRLKMAYTEELVPVSRSFDVSVFESKDASA